MDLQKLIIVPLIAGAIFIGACAGQQYQQRKVSENNLEQYFPETYEEKMIRRNKGKRFSNELIIPERQTDIPRRKSHAVQ